MRGVSTRSGACGELQVGPLTLSGLWVEPDFQGSCGLGSVGRCQRSGITRSLSGVEWGCDKLCRKFYPKHGLLSLLPGGEIHDIVLDR